MNNLELEIETIQIGIYCNIILNLLKKHYNLSLCKILVFSYLIKKDKFQFGKVYNANNSQDVVYKAISLLAGTYKDFCYNINFIIKSIHLLVINCKIELDNNILMLCSDIEVKSELYNESTFIFKAVEESKYISDRQIMREVINNV
jgi:hypothetical protein